MCGIAAVLGLTEEHSKLRLNEMLSRLSHRGPDGQGYAALSRVALGHQRLAIVDLTTGAQPLLTDQRSVATVVNGEIYNHLQLRGQLERRHAFASHSDSEVVLHGYEESGADFVRKLDGMFAFVVTTGDRTLAARDPLGIKPLYFGKDCDGHLHFASELKALAPHCDDLSYLPPGHVFDSERGVLPYFSPRWQSASPAGADEPPLGAIRDGLGRAVAKRLMSDVPIGVLLSGGLDSALVALEAARKTPQLHTFSVGTEGADDLSAAREVARLLGTRHHEAVCSPRDLAELLPSVVYHLESYDPALVRSAVPCFIVSRLASDWVKVVLTGEGADEAFAGYDYFRGAGNTAELHDECCRLLRGLHQMNLQRLDRMTMAHGIEGRVPFLDVEFLSLAMSLDPSWKMASAERPEKALLRRAFDGALPKELLWRKKAEFASGAGFVDLLRAHAEQHVSDTDFAARFELFPENTPRDKEAFLYRRLFEEAFPGHKLRHLVAGWAGALARPGKVPAEREESAKTRSSVTGAGERTYSDTVRRGFYGRHHGGLHGKHDNVRRCWEDQITRFVLSPYLETSVRRARAAGRKLRVLDLGCGAGQGLELLTSLRGTGSTPWFVPPALLGSGELSYLGVDLSAEMVEQGRQNHGQSDDVRFERVDLREGLGAAAGEAPFDVYLSTYGSFSHLDLEHFERLLAEIAQHGRAGAVVLVDLIGRYSLEWPGYWRAQGEEEKYRLYSMSYLYDERERRAGGVEQFMLRFWTGNELRESAQRASLRAARPLRLVRAVDRSLLVGRHVDTGEYGTRLPPLRSLVNRLHEPYVCTDLAELEIGYEAVPGFVAENAMFAELVRSWNTLIRFCRERLAGSTDEVERLAGWARFGKGLQSALVHLDRLIETASRIEQGEPRANLIEPQLGYLLRNLEYEHELGLGCGHGLLGVLQLDG